MPDWSYHGIFRPVLSKLPPTVSREFIHKRMNMIASLPFGLGGHVINFLGREESSPLLHKSFNGLRFKNQVGLSGKIDPHLTGTKAFTNLGFGFLEIGPVTIQPTENWTTPVVVEKDKRIIFPENAESIGLIDTINVLKKVKKKQPILIRLSGNSEEMMKMMDSLESFADGFIMEECELVKNYSSTKPIYLSVSASSTISFDKIKQFAGVVIEEGSGLAELKEKITKLRLEGYEGTVITSGGIYEPDDALQLFDAGADLVMLADGYVFSGPGLTKRINEALLDEINPKTSPQSGWFSYWFFGLFIFLGGLLALLFSVTTIILPYDEYFLGMKRDTIWAFNDRIMLFMAHDRMTLAGTMVSGGIVYMQLAKYGVKRGMKWAKQAIDAAAILGFLGIFAFIGYGYFDWLHLIFWLVLLPFYVVGFIKTRNISGTASSKNRKNHWVWSISLYGQLAFVILGFSFVIGGIIISYIGVTSVFVSTDLLYICMSPEMLEQFNRNLIPVIAHDRAGFGSALLSVGLLVLMLALWGFHQGNRWVWWTFFIGGFPAFFAGIYVHFAIGYTTFIHLLPAYFALVLYMVGLVLSYRFFHLTKKQ